ncbi:MAG: hypothetical protein M3Y72_06850, partial [Acidobacteriota bacterium]|nr:hypothetical protein [Acidobacteriota bacterium]
AKGVDTVLPSTNSWFVFDQHPGELHVVMLLTAEGTARPSDSLAGTDREPSTTEDHEGTDLASIKKLSGVQKGSKALQIETDDSPQQASEVHVVDSRLDPKMPPGQIVVEVRLLHRA